MSHNLFPKSPIFIPKFSAQEAAFVDLKLDLPAALMDAHVSAYCPNPTKKIRDRAEVFILDPVSNHFVERGYTSKPSFKKLVHVPEEPFAIEDLISNESLRVEQMVIPTIEHQLSEGAGLVILPYLFMEGTSDIKFGINLSMISDALKYARSQQLATPLFAMINVGASALGDPTLLNYIVQRYDDDFGDDIQGYFIVVDRLDGRKTDRQTLLGLAHLTHELTKNKKSVFVLKVGAFGEVLSALNATGFSSGLATGESFDEERLRLQLKPKGYGRPITKWTYVPELFNYVNDEALKVANYKCHCQSCGGSLPNDYSSKKSHFLYVRAASMAALQKLDRRKRVDLLRNRLKQGIALAQSYNKKHALNLQSGYLESWDKILEVGSEWVHEQDPDRKSVDLDKLIHEARAKRES